MRVADRLTLPEALGAALLIEARHAPNSEICGLIAAGVDKSPVHYPIANRASRTADRFEMDPSGQIAAFKRMRDHGQTLLAIYHSHPSGEAEPSMQDRRGHSYPDAAAVIVAPNAQLGDLIRAWNLAGDAACEIPIEWTGPTPRGGFL